MKKYVALTFDDGPNLVATPAVLERLKKYNITATFFVNGMHISPYEQGNIFNRDPLRVRKLLMHKKEIMKLAGLVSREGYTLVPLSLYFKGSGVKMAVGLCKGKKNYDKRESTAKRDAKREMDRTMKNYR